MPIFVCPEHGKIKASAESIGNGAGCKSCWRVACKAQARRYEQTVSAYLSGFKKPMNKSAPFVFGLGCTASGVFSTAYRAWVAKKSSSPGVMKYLTALTAKETGTKADIYLCETVSAFALHKDTIPDSAIAVIFDSPLLLAEVPGIHPLDYDKTQPHRFMLRPVSFGDFETARKKAVKDVAKGRFKSHPLTRIDRLGYVMDNTTPGVILTPFNAVSAQLPASDRLALRKAIVEVISGDIPAQRLGRLLSEMNSKVKNDLLSKGIDKLMASISSKNGRLLLADVKRFYGKKSSGPNKKDPRLFEIKYLMKMITSVRKSSSKEDVDG